MFSHSKPCVIRYEKIHETQYGYNIQTKDLFLKRIIAHGLNWENKTTQARMVYSFPHAFKVQTHGATLPATLQAMLLKWDNFLLQQHLHPTNWVMIM